MPHPHPTHYSQFDHMHNIQSVVQISKLRMYFSPLSCHLVPLQPKYSPQHPIRKYPQPAFLPQCEQPSFTPVQHNRQTYDFVYLNLFIIGQQTGTQKIRQQMTASIPPS
jgi:hypothetical protein